MRRVTFIAIACLSAWSIAAPVKNLGESLSKQDLPQFQEELTKSLRQSLRGDLTKALSNPQIRAKLAVYTLIQKVTPKGIEAVRKEKDGPKFLAWLASKPDALEDYLASGSSYSYSDVGLTNWSKIWALYPDSREGIGLRLATACSLVFFRVWNDMTYLKPTDPIKRYRFFMDSYKDKKLWPYFEKEKTYEYTYVVGAWAPDTELAWWREHIPDGLKSQEKVGDACWMVPYRTENEKKASAWDREKFYEGPGTMDAMIKKGGICIQIAEFTSSAAQAFGIPGIQVGQPSHNATAWRDKEGSWRLAYQIVDWPDTNQEYIPLQFGTRAVLLWMADSAQVDMPSFMASERLLWAAPLMADKKLDTLTLALGKCPLNYPAIVQAVTEASTKLKGAELSAYLLKVVKPIKDYPFPVLDQVQDRIGDLPSSLASTCTALDFVESILTTLAEGNPERQFGCTARVRGDLVAKVLRAVTKTELDFSSPVWNGTNADKTWAALDLNAKMNYLRGIEMILKTGMKRKDLYEHALNTYTAYAIADRTAAVRAIPVLGSLAKQALNDKVTPFAQDACRKLAEICDKKGDKEAAETWRKLGS